MLHHVAVHYAEADVAIGVVHTHHLIAERETGRTLDDKLSAAAAALVVDFVERLRAGGQAIPRRPQDESRATRAPMPREKDLRVHWTDDARSSERLVHACDQTLLAIATIGGEDVGLVKIQLAAARAPLAQP